MKNILSSSLKALAASLVIAALVSMYPQAGYAAAGNVIAPDSTTTVEVQKGKLVQLARSAVSIMIADPNIADIDVKSPRSVYVFGKRSGETTLYALDEHDKTIISTVIRVTHNLSGLTAAVKELMPASAINFRSIDGGLVMDGAIASPIQAGELEALATPYLGENEKLINRLKVGGSDQVTLRLRVAEVSRTQLQEFGINMQNLLTAGNFVFGIGTGRPVLDAANNIISRSGEANSMFGRYNNGRYDINGVIDALAQEGYMTVLAEPNLTAMSGQDASFLAGGEFPIPVVGQDGQVTIEFRKFGVSLDFTPTVLSADRISLHVAPEVSTLSQEGAITVNGFNIPSLSTRRTDTTVELASGQSFAIAGLLKNDTSNNLDKFPGLGDVPVLGTLFRSSRFQSNETELVVIITPYITKGVEEASLKTPLDGFAPPSDIERILLGKLYKEHAYDPSQAPVPAIEESLPHLNGPVGFVLD